MAKGTSLHGKWQLYKYESLTNRSVKMAGYRPSSFLVCVYGRDRVEIQKHAKTNEAHVQCAWEAKSEHAGSIKDLLKTIFLRDPAGNPARVANHNAGFGLSCLLTGILTMYLNS